MTTERETTDIGPQERADNEAVLRHPFHGEPLDPEISRRVRERAAKVTEEIRLVHGIIDDATFQTLIHDDDDDET